MTSRQEARSQFDEKTRLALLEADADNVHADVASLRAVINRLIWSIVGATFTLATATVLFALDLVVK